eukprot:3452437-Amphidinium_carterae.1
MYVTPTNLKYLTHVRQLSMLAGDDTTRMLQDPGNELKASGIDLGYRKGPGTSIKVKLDGAVSEQIKQSEIKPELLRMCGKSAKRLLQTCEMMWQETGHCIPR